LKNLFSETMTKNFASLLTQKRNNNFTRNLLEQTGFTNIVENDDGSFDGVHNSFHYKSLRITNCNGYIEDTIVSEETIKFEPVTLINRKKSDLIS